MSHPHRLDADGLKGRNLARDICSCAPDLLCRDEVRCNCGSLLARLVSGGVELKCRRCKRTVTLAVSGGGPARAIKERK